MATWTPELERRFQEIRQICHNLGDPGHDGRHVDAVVKQAIVLAEIHAPDQLVLVEIAAVCHDIGLINGRDDHENTGAAAVLADLVFRKALTHEELKAVAGAVRQHRASTGNPTAILEQIIADADRSPIDTSHAFMRAFEHGLRHNPELNHEGQLRRAARHLFEKYGPEGYGRRTFFKETERCIQQTMQPIFDAHVAGDLGAMQAFLDEEKKAA